MRRCTHAITYLITACLTSFNLLILYLPPRNRQLTNESAIVPQLKCLAGTERTDAGVFVINKFRNNATSFGWSRVEGKNDLFIY